MYLKLSFAFVIFSARNLKKKYQNKDPSKDRAFALEVAISDSNRTRRRLVFTANLKEKSVNPLHARFPIFDATRMEQTVLNTEFDLMWIDSFVLQHSPLSASSFQYR